MENYKTELNNLSESERNAYNDLHVLRLVQVHGSITIPTSDRTLEELLTRQDSEGTVREETRGFWFWKRQVYALTNLAQEYLSKETNNILKTAEELKTASEPEIATILRNNGYTPSEYVLKKSILVDNLFDNAQVGIFNQENKLGDYVEELYANRLSRLKSNHSSTLSATATTNDGHFNNMLLWMILSDDNNSYHQHSMGSDNHYFGHDHSGHDVGGCNDHSSHDSGGSDFGSFDSGGYDSGSFDG